MARIGFLFLNIFSSWAKIVYFHWYLSFAFSFLITTKIWTLFRTGNGQDESEPFTAEVWRRCQGFTDDCFDPLKPKQTSLQMKEMYVLSHHELWIFRQLKWTLKYWSQTQMSK